MALKNDSFNIKAITTVAGNVDLNQATSNALYTCEICDKFVPVYKGEGHPLKRKLETSKFFHGKDGLGDTGPYEPSKKAEAENAKVSIRNVRREGNSQLKEFLKEKEISQDEERQGEELIQKLTDTFVEKVDKALEAKEKDLLDF